jgi:hypothetical protein
MPLQNQLVIANLALLALGCDAPEVVDDPPWGIGDKADGLCAPEDELCWNAADTAAMRELFTEQDRVAIADDPRPAAVAAVDAAYRLTHKMTAQESAALDDLVVDLQGLAPGDVEGGLELIRRLNEGPLYRLSGLYFTAYMVPAGWALARDNPDAFESFELDGFGSGGKFDSAGDEAEAMPAGGTEGINESLELLRESGPLGIVLVKMFAMSGILEHDYQVMNAKQFGEYNSETGEIVPSGMSREAKVAAIIARYKRAGALVGAGAGLVGSIPIAGQIVAIPGELYHLWRLHTKMAFQIAAVYGWDLRVDRNLYNISLMVLVRDSLKEAGQTFVSFMVIPALLKAIAPRFGGFEISKVVLRKVAAQPLLLLIDNLLMREGREWLIHAATSRSVRSLAGQLLPIAGAAINMSIGATVNWIATKNMGEHVQVLSRRWLTDLMLDGTTYLADRPARDCAFRALAAIAVADGGVSEREAGLYMAFLAKPYNLDDRTTFELSSRERFEQSRMLAGAAATSPDCLGDELDGAAPQHRLALLSHLYAMMSVDLDHSSEESALYADMVDRLDGSGLFDGDALDASQLEYVERAIFTTLNPTVEVDDPGIEDLVDSIVPEDTLEFLASPDPEVARDFDCGLDPGCSG